MDYNYIKALHIIFIVTWFSGLFYVVRLFVYRAEAAEKTDPERTILLNQLNIMTARLWKGITWPSAIITLFLGPYIWYKFNGFHHPPTWLAIKLLFVIGLYAYHISLHSIFKQQNSGNFKWTSMRLRIWNEVATIFLVAIVMLAAVKDGMSLIYGLGGLVAFIIILMSAIKIYKALRNK
jgi:putative membrane protein